MPGGCEDPRVAVTEDGLYVMMYTQWNRHVPRLAVATSRNLKDWTKHGPAFAKAYNGKFFNLGCKSGSILTEVVKGKQLIKKINGQYFMYWGEEHVFAATSDDLINWTPVVNIDGSLKKLFSPPRWIFRQPSYRMWTSGYLHPERHRPSLQRKEPCGKRRQTLHRQRLCCRASSFRCQRTDPLHHPS